MSWLRRGRVVLLCAVIVGHLLALYLPGSPEPSSFDVPGLDKIVHVALFAVPAYLIKGLTSASWPLWLLIAHAPISELVQWRVVPYRSGDPLDLLADLVGVALGWWLASVATGNSGGDAAESGHDWAA